MYCDSLSSFEYTRCCVGLRLMVDGLVSLAGRRKLVLGSEA